MTTQTMNDMMNELRRELKATNEERDALLATVAEFEECINTALEHWERDGVSAESQGAFSYCSDKVSEMETSERLVWLKRHYQAIGVQLFSGHLVNKAPVTEVMNIHNGNIRKLVSHADIVKHADSLAELIRNDFNVPEKTS